MGFTSVSICHKLGIMYHDYESILETGKERGIFEYENKLSSYGLDLYYDAKKCIEKFKKTIFYESDMQFEIKTIKYLPKKFNGRS